MNLNTANATDVEELSALVDSLCELAEEGITLRYLRRVAEVSDASHLRLSSQEIARRRGPFPYYSRAFDIDYIDDYSFDQPSILVGSKGAISLTNGKLLVIRAEGKYSFSDNFLQVLPKPEDSEYIEAVLRMMNSGRYAKGTNVARVITKDDLSSAFIPWPDAETRTKFVMATNAINEIDDEELRSKLENAWLDAARNVQYLDTSFDAPESQDAESDGNTGSAGNAESTSSPEGEPEMRASKILDVVDAVLSAATSSLSGSHAGDQSTNEDPIMLDVVANTTSLADPHVSNNADICICFPPPYDEEWTSDTVDTSDPRWVFGTPPRNKADFAWIQHTFAHMPEGGVAVMLLRNANLHSSLGREQAVREAWAESGIVEAVIALPGGIFEDGRAPSSIVVMRKDRDTEKGTLFINLLDKGDFVGRKQDSTAVRTISDETIDRIYETYTKWLAGENIDFAGFSCSASREDIAANHFFLTPWDYV